MTNEQLAAIKARQEERHRDREAAYNGGERVMTRGALNKDLIVADVDALLAAHGMCPGCGHGLVSDHTVGRSSDFNEVVVCMTKGCPCEDFRL